MSVLNGAAPNTVQLIGEYSSLELQNLAMREGQHFLFAQFTGTNDKSSVLNCIAKSFGFPDYFGFNFDALYDCLTDSLFQSGVQKGFVVVLEDLPNTTQFDIEMRETLMDIFRDSANFWASKNIPFRVFYSFN
ncbi:barstar family protein [Undibacterium fentianense]|uniref:Barstar family protein n=1 Tax=Undibacterium fentianense TaxID=2828728 RepID=A0A941E2E9_9BURK|nr:barstar family protein [Undibacterium fentianense]MBR7799987.1 barstar family protein [Undibacterium fentianense]